VVKADDIYTDIILDLYRNPSNFGTLESPDLEIYGGNPLCGDEVKFTLKIKDGKVDDVNFTGHGCAISRASESLLTELVKGKAITDVLKLENTDIFEVLGNVIETRIKCSLLGLIVIKRGLEKYQKDPAETKKVSGIVI